MALVWPFVPESLTGELSWQTEILKSYVNEQRIRIRSYPRVSLKMTNILYEDGVHQARMLIERASNDWLVPDWRYSQVSRGPYTFTDTILSLQISGSYLEVGDAVIVWEDELNYVTGEIAAIGASDITLTAPLGGAFVNPHIAPLLSAYTDSQISFNYKGYDAVETQLEMKSKNYKNRSQVGIGEAIYKTYAVLLDRTVFVGSITEKLEKVVEIVDNGAGQIVLEPVYNHFDFERTLGFIDQRADRRLARETFFHRRYGKQKPFWLPTWTKDYFLLANANAGATTITVRNRGIESDYAGRYVLFYMKDGTSQRNKILSASITGTTATLTLETALSAPVTLSTLDTLCDISLVRLESDVVRMEYTTGLVCSIDVPVAGLNYEL